MDDHRFDDWTRTLAASGSRRHLLGGFAAAALGFVGLGRAEAATCRAAGRTCRQDANCCSDYCGPRDLTGRHRCECLPPTVACRGQCLDPATAFQGDPDNCGACGTRCPHTRCQIATCDLGICGLAPNPDRIGVDCDDGNPCTIDDVCTDQGTCAGTPVTCPICQTCDSVSGNCVVVADTTACAGGVCCGGACIAGECCADGDCPHTACETATCTDGTCDVTPITCPECQTCEPSRGFCSSARNAPCDEGAGRCCSGSCISPCLGRGAPCEVGACVPTHCDGCCNGNGLSTNGFVCN